MFCGDRPSRFGRPTGQAGFSFVEMLIAVALAAILVIVIYQIFIKYKDTVTVQEDVIDSQQSGRIALAKLKEDLMLIGRNAKVNEGQEMMIYAAPWELVFNGDITDEFGQPSNPITINYGPGNNLSYTTANWADNNTCETVHYYMHEPNVANEEKDYSYSPYDREIRRAINDQVDPPVSSGESPSAVIGYGVRYDDGTSAMAYDNGEHITPLFTYWGDFDLNPTTVDTLWGDTDANGRLSTAEISALLTGNYSWSYTGPSGAVSITNIPAGAILLIANGGAYTNDEDLDGDNLLDPGEDYNRNGKLDHNILASVIHRIELNITTIAQNPDLKYHHPRDYNYRFRETWVNTAVEPRNLARTQVRECGEPPQAPGSVLVACQDCGRGISVTWNRSPDDGVGDNDVLWYEIYRRAAPEGGGTGDWVYLTMVPADGATSYNWLDANIIAGRAHQYQIYAVDCGDGRSTGTLSNSVTCAAPLATAPDSNYFYAYDTPQATPGSTGSITLVWQASLDGGVPDEDVTEYWIYRSEPENTDSIAVPSAIPSGGANEWPLAKVKASPSDPEGPNTSCTSVTTLDYFDTEAHADCVDQKYWMFGNFYVWHDEIGGAGRFGGALAPVPGGQFGIGTNQQRYFYQIRAYTGADECLSLPASLQSNCDDYSDVQSFDCGSTISGRSRFTPPLTLTVSDLSTYSYIPNTTDVTSFQLTWSHSLSEYCTLAACEDPDWYYVYRGSLPYATLTTGSRGHINFGSNMVLAFRAGSANPSSTTNYSWIESSDTWGDDTAHTAMWLDLSAQDLRPSTGSSVPSGYALTNTYSEDAYYEYMVAAANTDGSGNPATPWGFGASCIKQAKWDCGSECIASVLVDSGYAEQHSMHGDKYPSTAGDDSIDVYWQFAQAPGGGTEVAGVRLLARAWPGGAWEVVSDEVRRVWAAGVTYMLSHEYINQVPGTLYEYGLEIQCYENGVAACKRILLPGVVFGSCTPGVPKWCYSTSIPGCPSDAHAYCNPEELGKVVFYITDTLPDNDGHGLDTQISQTADQYEWFRIARWQKAPDAANYPVIPASQYLIRADGYSYADPVAPNQRYSTFPGLWSAAITANERRYRFQEYLDPTLDHRYMVEVRVTHSVSVPIDCSPPATTCNGPEGDYIYVDFQSLYPCYPYTYSGFGGTTPIVNLQRDWFNGMSGEIHSDSIPWKNYEVTFISFNFWGLSFTVADYMFQYGGSNNRIESDLDGFFGGLLNWVIQYVSDIGYGLCHWCVSFWGADLFCVSWFWPDCEEDLGRLFNHSFLWSNFEYGHCGSNGTGTAHTIKGDFIAEWRWKSVDPGRRLVMSFRGAVDPLSNRIDTWLLEQSFEPTHQVDFTIGYEYVTNCEDEYYNREAYNDQYDDDWWTNLLLVCTKRSGNDSTGLGQMYLFWWARPSEGNPSDELQDEIYTLAPKLAWHTIGATFGTSGAYYTSTAPYSNVAHVDGAIGFWADPYVDWEVDNYYYSGVRLIQFCGACPPRQLEHYLPSPYEKMSWPEGGKAPRKAACVDWGKNYEYNRGVPPIRKNTLKKLRERGLNEVPAGLDPWYEQRRRLPNRQYNRP